MLKWVPIGCSMVMQRCSVPEGEPMADKRKGRSKPAPVESGRPAPRLKSERVQGRKATGQGRRKGDGAEPGRRDPRA
jgi:hypothetical protein